MARQIVDVDKPFHKQLPFAQGVIVDGPVLFTAGITARDESGAVIGPGDMRAQIEACFGNLGDVLREVGATFDDVVKIVMYTTDMEEMGKHPEVWRAYFTGRPASTGIEVSRLALPEMLLEIEAVVALER